MHPEPRAAGRPGPAEEDRLRIRWGYVWLAWLGVAVLFIAQNVVGGMAAGVPFDLQWAVIHEVIYWGLWAALTPLLLSWSRRHPLGRGSGWRPWLAHLAFALVIAPVQTFATYGLHLLGLFVLGLGPTAGEWIEARQAAFLVISITGVWKYAIVVGIHHAFDYYHRYRVQEREGDRLAVRTAQLEERLARSRLDALRMQLHPHFLFNTLNSISVLNTEEPERARRMLLRLSDLLRTVLETDEPEVELDWEMEVTRRYLDIQQIRYEHRLAVDVEVEPDARSARVPCFLLQPLVENAVRHGVERSARANRVRIRALRRGATLRVEVENRVPADAPAARRAADGGGIGLRNTRARLEQMYGDAHRFEVGPQQDGATFAVRIEIPFRRDSSEE